MKSSSEGGTCNVCGHGNNVHSSENCGAKNCRKKIKVCGATLHYIPALQIRNHAAWVVCKPCPDHGSKSKFADYSELHVISKDKDGNIIIVEKNKE